jgi:HSP20 family protein
MSNLIRWEPAREMMTLRQAMDRLFDEAFTRPFSLTRESGAVWSSPAIDMYQTDNDVVVKAALPGIKADDVHINISGDILTIKGEAQQEEEKQEKSWYIREQRWGAFERAIRLPTAVIADRAKADFESGILTINLPKSKESRPKTINIKTK